jgi:predicted enzyme related to lactoylglutathione lyase
MAAEHGRFVWYELITSDPDAAEAFYSDVVGWQIADAEMPGMDYRMGRGNGGMVCGILPLTQDMIDSGTRAAWYGYIAVDNVDESVDNAKASGGQLHVPPTDIPQVGRFAQIADPQGVPIYLMQMAGDDAPEAYQSEADGHCAWNELTTSDYDAAIDFYSSAFDWNRGEQMDMGAMGHYQILRCNDENMAGVLATFDGGPPPMWRYYFRVPALAPAIEKINSLGGTVIHGPQPVAGGDEIIVGIDPQGAIFCLVATTA